MLHADITILHTEIGILHGEIRSLAAGTKFSVMAQAQNAAGKSGWGTIDKRSSINDLLFTGGIKR